MRTHPARPAPLLPLLLALAVGAACSATRIEDAPPPWSRNPATDLDERVVLAGVGSARGDDADAADAARRAAMAAVLEQLVARVEAQTDSHQSESSHETLDARGLETRILASDLRERIIKVSSEGELLGTRFELARADAATEPRTWARAVVDRTEMADHALAAVSEDLARGREAIAAARRALSPGSTASEAVARGIQDALAGEAALTAPRAALPLLVAIRPAAGSRAASESARIARLDQEAVSLLAEIAVRLDVQLEGTTHVGFGGQVSPVGLRARWDGAALPGLMLAVQNGAGPTASGRTDTEGRVTLSVPAAAAGKGADLGLRAGPDLDGRLGAISITLPVNYPRPADSRLVLLSRHERVDADAARVSISPSPLQSRLEELLGSMNFPLVAAELPAGSNVLSPTLAPALAGQTDYVLQLGTRTAYSSSDSTRGPLWYRSTVELRMTEVSTGEALTVTITERDTKAAGATAEQAAERSLATALEILSRPENPASLVGVLRARFR